MEKISVIVPRNPFVRNGSRQNEQCLAALDVEKLMTWWPGRPHEPEVDRERVRSIQRSLDWKRVAEIAAYLLQQELTGVRDLIDRHFTEFYNPRELDPEAEWPPRVSDKVRFHPSIYPNFSNVLIHINGARLEPEEGSEGSGHLVIPENRADLRLSVIDGQHRINGAYLALQIKRSQDQVSGWEIPAQIFLDLDEPNGPPQHQAVIFIDINFYQKKVDKSLVTDLFPTTRIGADTGSDIERAEDLGRRLMLEEGPLVGMIQIPGIKYGVKNVVALSTLVGAIEDILPWLRMGGLSSLGEQATFLARCLDAWLAATGRKEEVEDKKVSPHNVVYQGRIMVSFLALIPACIHHLKEEGVNVRSPQIEDALRQWLHRVLTNADLLHDGKFVVKARFQEAGYLGSGGIGRFRDRLWAATSGPVAETMEDDVIKLLAKERRKAIHSALQS